MTARAQLDKLAAAFGEELTLDALTQDFFIFQRRRGHRHSTDDLLTAWYATDQLQAATTLLDLGSGIGSVGLSCLWHFRTATLTAIEAQAISYRLLLENLAVNGVMDQVIAHHGDLREVDLGDRRFELITGSPPYFPAHTGIIPNDSQKAHARFELRGDVSDYCRAAKRWLAEQGSFVFCFPSPQRARAEAAITASGLVLVASREVVPKAGLKPLFSLFCCRQRGVYRAEPDFIVRDEHGEHTEMMLKARAVFGMGFTI